MHCFPVPLKTWSQTGIPGPQIYKYSDLHSNSYRSSMTHPLMAQVRMCATEWCCFTKQKPILRTSINIISVLRTFWPPLVKKLSTNHCYCKTKIKSQNTGHRIQSYLLTLLYVFSQIIWTLFVAFRSILFTALCSTHSTEKYPGRTHRISWCSKGTQ